MGVRLFFIMQQLLPVLGSMTMVQCWCTGWGLCIHTHRFISFGNISLPHSGVELHKQLWQLWCTVRAVPLVTSSCTLPAAVMQSPSRLGDKSWRMGSLQASCRCMLASAPFDQSPEHLNFLDRWVAARRVYLLFFFVTALLSVQRQMDV